MCALWAVGCWLGLAAAAAAQQPVTPAVCTSCPGGGCATGGCATGGCATGGCAEKACAAACRDGCRDGCRESCWSKFCNWLCYRALPVPCECVGHHCAPCQCAPPVPLFFLHAHNCGVCNGYSASGCVTGGCATGDCATGACTTGCGGSAAGCCAGCGLSHR